MAQWFLSAKKADFQKTAEKYGIDPVIARLIRNRDIVGEEAIRRYLKGDREDMYAPSLCKDMDRAILLLTEKINKKAKIRVIGDYDADGICSAYILIKGLTLCGAKADTVIPHRIKDGYGLNETLLKEAHRDGIDTVITCDNGIAAAEQIAYAKRLGMTVIVTDHHEVPYRESEDGGRVYLLPEADAVIDPKQEGCGYPFKGICGGMVAYKVVQELFLHFHPENEETWLEELIEIAAFATVCDVMELKDENRILVKYGLRLMRNTRNTGLKALIQTCGLEGKELSAYHIGFVLGPCMNATGRLDTAERALSLLMSEEYAEAVRIAAELKELNDSRKEMTVKGTKEAEERIEGSSLKEDKVLVLYMQKIHESLAGIIAGRIREKYHKPVFVLTRGEDAVKGSGRSIEGYDMYEAMTKCRDLFLRFGGHKMAAGLSMKEENIERFRRRLNEECTLTEEDFEEKIHIDVAMPLSYLTKERIRQLKLLEPFGVGNPKPVFALKDIRVINGRILGKNQNVGKYGIRDGNGVSYEMVYFGDLEAFDSFLAEKAGKEQVRRLYAGNGTDISIDITYYPEINSYAGKETLQIVMLNYR